MTHRTLFAVIAIAVMAAAAAASAEDDKPFWSGWYFGANAGGTWGDRSHRLVAAPGDGAVVMPPQDVNQIKLVAAVKSNPGGFAGGGEAGYNLLFRYRDGGESPDYVLVGIETDVDYLVLKQSRAGTFTSALTANPPTTPPTPVTASVAQATRSHWQWTLRPRLGYATGHWLFFATGGLALSDVRLTTAYSDTYSPSHAVSATDSSTQVGWTVGGGIGYAISANWSVKAEYLYSDFGNVNHTLVIPNRYGVIASEAAAKTNVARVGVDFRF
jgi:outer membrane immunogenic protein